MFQKRDRLFPRGRTHWTAVIDNIDWRRAWLLPHKYFLPNKTEEDHFKILHKIYFVNSTVSKYVDFHSTGTFCGNEDETWIHIFYSCDWVQKFWFDLHSHLNKSPIYAQSLNVKDIISYYTDSANNLENIFSTFFLFCSANPLSINKNVWVDFWPSHFLIEVDSLLTSFCLSSNKKVIDFWNYVLFCFFFAILLIRFNQLSFIYCFHLIIFNYLSLAGITSL